MNYKYGDKVDFKDYQDNKRSGVVGAYTNNAFWIKVKQGFSFLEPVEYNNKIVKWLNKFSPTIEYFVPISRIIGLTAIEEGGKNG